MLSKISIVFVILTSTFSQCFPQLATEGVMYASTYDGEIYELNANFSKKTLAVATDIKYLSSVAVNSSGRAFAVDGHRLYELDLSSGEKTFIAGMPDSTWVLDHMGTVVFDRNDELYVIKSTSGGCGAAYFVYHFDFSTSLFTKKWVFGSGCPNGDTFTSIAFDPIDDGSYGLLRTSGEVFSFDLNVEPVGESINWIRKTLSQGNLKECNSLIFSREGRLFAVSPNKVLLVDRTSGKTSEVYYGSFKYSSLFGVNLEFGSLINGLHDNDNGFSYYPVPIVEELTIKFSSFRQNQGLFEVFDISGHSVSSSSSFNVSRGENIFKWEPKAVSGERMPAGIYVIKLAIGNERQIVKRVVVSSL